MYPFAYPFAFPVPTSTTSPPAPSVIHQAFAPTSHVEARHFRRMCRGPSRLVWFAIGSLTTYWWMRHRAPAHHLGYCRNSSGHADHAITSPEDEPVDSQGRSFPAPLRRMRSAREAAKDEEERAKAWAEMAAAREQTKETVKEFAGARVDDLLAALTALRQELKPSIATPSSPSPSASAKLV